MEFFIFLEAFFILSNPVLSEMGINPMPQYAPYVIASVLFFVVYAFKAVGLSTMAKKQGKEAIAWCAFVPFASTWLIGKLSLSMRFGGKKFPYFGLIAMIVEILLAVCYAIMFALQTYAFSNNFYVITIGTGEMQIPSINTSPDFPRVLDNLLSVTVVATNVLNLPYLAALVFLYIGFFRMYAPMSYIWMVVLCVIIQPVFGILAFAFRNRNAVDYEAIVKKRMEEIYKMEHPNEFNSEGEHTGPADPFGEFSSGQSQQEQQSSDSASKPSRPDDPFDEF